MVAASLVNLRMIAGVWVCITVGSPQFSKAPQHTLLASHVCVRPKPAHFWILSTAVKNWLHRTILSHKAIPFW